MFPVAAFSCPQPTFVLLAICRTATDIVNISKRDSAIADKPRDACVFCMPFSERGLVPRKQMIGCLGSERITAIH